MGRRRRASVEEHQRLDHRESLQWCRHRFTSTTRAFDMHWDTALCALLIEGFLDRDPTPNDLSTRRRRETIWTPTGLVSGSHRIEDRFQVSVPECLREHPQKTSVNSIPKNPSTFSEADWRHFCVSLEGPNPKYLLRRYLDRMGILLIFPQTVLWTSETEPPCPITPHMNSTNDADAHSAHQFDVGTFGDRNTKP